jgi:hypothetical protein
MMMFLIYAGNLMSIEKFIYNDKFFNIQINKVRGELMEVDIQQVQIVLFYNFWKSSNLFKIADSFYKKF